MTKEIENTWVAALLLVVLLGSACIPSIQRRPVGPPVQEVRETADEDSLSLNKAQVYGRILAMEELLEKKKSMSRSDETAARDILRGYKNVMQLLDTAPETGSGDSRLMSEILFGELVKLEKLHFHAAQEEREKASTHFSWYHRKRSYVREQFLLGNFENALRACQELEQAYGRERVIQDIGPFWAVSLAETGKVVDAIRLGQETLPELEGQHDPIYLYSRMVSWNLDIGDQEKARENYNKLVDSLNQANTLLKTADRSLRPVEAERVPPPSSTLEDISHEKLPGPLVEALERVRDLIQKKAFDDAKLLLVRQKIRYSNGAEARAVEKAMERVEMAERDFKLKGSNDAREELEDAIEEIRAFIEREKYEAALQRLDAMKPSDDIRIRITALKDQATSGIIQQDRDKAARLYLKARNTVDVSEKQRSLNSSYQLLKNLLDRFPDSPMAPKIQDNLDTVKIEMEKSGMSLKE